MHPLLAHIARDAVWTAPLIFVLFLLLRAWLRRKGGPPSELPLHSRALIENPTWFLAIDAVVFAIIIATPSYWLGDGFQSFLIGVTAGTLFAPMSLKSYFETWKKRSG